MGHLEALDHEAHALRGECGVHGPADGPGHRHEVGGQLLGEVDPRVDLLARDHQHVALGERLDGQERDALLVGPDETAGQLALDDLGEH